MLTLFLNKDAARATFDNIDCFVNMVDCSDLTILSSDLPDGLPSRARSCWYFLSL
jgi:hypothetical protein